MAQDDIARDGEAEAGAAGLAVARGLEALEGGESPLHLIGRDAGAVVADLDDERAPLVGERDADLAAIFAAIIDEVRKGAPQRHRPASQLRVIRPFVGNGPA